MKLDDDLEALLKRLGCTYAACGSRVTCSPTPTDTDRDFLVLVPSDNVGRLVHALSEKDFKWEGDEHYQDAAGDFMSWRFDDINLIVTKHAGFATRHSAATQTCKFLNIQDKAHRIAIFQAVLYGDRKKAQPKVIEPEHDIPEPVF